jgi:hypothetical protein
MPPPDSALNPVQLAHRNDNITYIKTVFEQVRRERLAQKATGAAPLAVPSPASFQPDPHGEGKQQEGRAGKKKGKNKQGKGGQGHTKTT